MNIANQPIALKHTVYLLKDLELLGSHHLSVSILSQNYQGTRFFEVVKTHFPKVNFKIKKKLFTIC